MSLTHNTATNAPPPPSPLTTAEINDYLDYTSEALITRREKIIAALQATAFAYPTIDDDRALGEAAENIRMAAALTRSAEDKRKEVKKPFLDGERTVDSWFKNFSTPLTQAMTKLQVIMNDYGARKLAAARLAAEQERRRAQAEADRLAAIAAAQLRKGQDADKTLARAAIAAHAADTAQDRTDARPADLTRTTGDYGATASVRQTWGWEIEDIDAIPRQYLQVNPDAIKAAAKQRSASGKPVAVIPGIRWTATTKVGVR